VLDSRSLIQVDLPDAANIVLCDEPEIVLAVRVVVVVELTKHPNLAEYRAALFCWQSFKASCDDHHAAEERATKRVVKFLDPGDRIWPLVRHGFLNGVTRTGRPRQPDGKRGRWLARRERFSLTISRLSRVDGTASAIAEAQSCPTSWSAGDLTCMECYTITDKVVKWKAVL
jgi:hypothetical protein